MSDPAGPKPHYWGGKMVTGRRCQVYWTSNKWDIGRYYRRVVSVGMKEGADDAVATWCQRSVIRHIPRERPSHQ